MGPTTYAPEPYDVRPPAAAPAGVASLIEMMAGQVMRLEEQIAVTGKVLSPVLDTRAAAQGNTVPNIDTRSEIGGQLAELLARITVATDRLSEMVNAVDVR